MGVFLEEGKSLEVRQGFSCLRMQYVLKMHDVCPEQPLLCITFNKTNRQIKSVPSHCVYVTFHIFKQCLGSMGQTGKMYTYDPA